MAVLDIFSKRQRRARGDVPDVLLGGPIPSAFRAQVIPIWRDVWGPGPSHNGVRLPPQPSGRACGSCGVRRGDQGCFPPRRNHHAEPACRARNNRQRARRQRPAPSAGLTMRGTILVWRDGQRGAGIGEAEAGSPALEQCGYVRAGCVLADRSDLVAAALEGWTKGLMCPCGRRLAKQAMSLRSRAQRRSLRSQ